MRQPQCDDEHQIELHLETERPTDRDDGRGLNQLIENTFRSTSLPKRTMVGPRILEVVLNKANRQVNQMTVQ